MRRKTHNLITRMLLPDVNHKTITKVNKAIDNPDVFSILISSLTQGLGDIGINKKGIALHRKVNHDLASALITGYVNGGIDGAKVALTHLATDLLSDHLVKIGVRDIVEAILNVKINDNDKSR